LLKKRQKKLFGIAQKSLQSLPRPTKHSHLPRPLLPSHKSSSDLAGPLEGPDLGLPLVEPLERGCSPSQLLISPEELAFIVAFRQALDQKDMINWEAFQGLREFDRLRLEAILDLSDMAVDGTLPSARVITASQLPVVVHVRLGGRVLSAEVCRSGIFYPRN
jgi:hypothetical protein